MSFNHFPLARVNQLLQITYDQLFSLIVKTQGKQVEYWLWCACIAYKEA